MTFWQHRLSLLLLLLLPWLPYGQVWHFSFLNLDDDSYISQVPQLLQGWSWDNWRWAWTTADPFIMPVVRLTFLTEASLYGVHSGGFHLVNVLFHAANTLLLFALFRRWTGDYWRSWLVAALFALHPQHVEAVAWASERKEVMSAFFALLCLWSYSCYAEKGRRYQLWYAASLAGLLVSLLCKPMWVTMPALLLLLDYWPLKRTSLGMVNLLKEKILFLMIALAVSATTVLTFHQGGHFTSLQTLPIVNRLSNLMLGYVGYLQKTVWPLDLGLPYRASPDLPDWSVYVTHLSILFFLSLLAWRWRGRHPVLMVAWGWFLISLLPVSGLLEGGQPLVMADRRMYVPHMLLLAALVWPIPIPHSSKKRIFIAGVWLSLLISLAWLTADYTRHWRDSTTLWRHFIQQGFEADFARWALSMAYAEEGNLTEAIKMVHHAHSHDPLEATFIRTLGNYLQQSGDTEKAWQVRRYLVQAQSPTTLNSLKEVGLNAFLEKRPQDAILLLGEFWQRSKNHDSAVAFALGHALHEDGQGEETEKLWQEFFQEEPANHRQKCADMASLASQYGPLPLANALAHRCANP